ncbi:uncharacterized protein B0H18DRAFT_881127 [Fomitopsis serialis]|uniref:uncharacterized protein n=1 Tax=Fomitopsis serialis TaxID=139415 RepID=UPI0020083C84|nr:uncharacterized protein B0H18DRAFT_881127 [Neoantrodia serialis]KAH9920365.1 hypothetical protein B0H18DRAFT_881127 [Neoantrodia serialis]
MHANWNSILPDLVEAYINWQDSPPTPDCDEQLPHFTIDVFNIFTLQTTVTIILDEEASSPRALLRNGYLGTSPIQPTLAISLSTLELFRRIQLFKASFSVEAFAKLMCHYYKIAYRRHYRAIVADAYEVYITILRAVQKRVDRVLGRDVPDWRVMNACPPCGYEVSSTCDESCILEDEPPMTWSRMVCMDGNMSLKRIASIGARARGDLRVLGDSDYFLPSSFVDQFANEVRSHKQDDNVDAPPDDTGGDPTDGADPSQCTKNWKASASEDKKGMWGIFDETGIFASACQHGMILWLINMVRSGELAKYPLAIAAKIIDVLPQKCLNGYDIGCDFAKTLQNSSLGERWRVHGSRCCVNAFHGCSHNYWCQLNHHPNVIVGMGIEDLETLEHVFSASNQLASITRYSSPYHRRLAIEQYFQQWDAEKYANLSVMIYNNYVQALNIIETDTLALNEAMSSMHVTVDMLRQWQVEEHEYFRTLGREAPWDVHAMAYVENLQELRSLRAQLQKASTQLVNSIPAGYTFALPQSGSVNYNAETSRMRKAETERRYLVEWERALAIECTEMELHMGIPVTWESTDALYQETLRYMANRTYERALDKLQQLVVKRLFELHKMNLSQTAYRVRTHISKSLQKRCKAIRTAVNSYNKAAAELNPPRAPLDWLKVSHYNFLDEFELLKDTRNDVRKRPWVRPDAREMMRQLRRLDRANEEIDRCNVQARRLYTAIADEHDQFLRVIGDLKAAEDPLHGIAVEYCERRLNVNVRHIERLHQLASLKGFTGNLSRGRRKGAPPPTPSPSAHPPIAQNGPNVTAESPAGNAAGLTAYNIPSHNHIHSDDGDGGDSDGEDDDETQGDVGNLVDFMGNASR